MNLRRFDSLLSQCCFKKRRVMQTSRYADVALCRRRVMQTSRYADVAFCRRRVMQTSRYEDVTLCRRRVMQTSSQLAKCLATSCPNRCSTSSHWIFSRSSNRRPKRFTLRRRKCPKTVFCPKGLKMKNATVDGRGSGQCDQIGQLMKVDDNIFSYKSCPNIFDFWAIFEKNQF